jgi:hypothetical protein
MLNLNRAKPHLLPIATVVLLAVATDAQAKQTSAAPISGQPTMESTEAGSAGRPESAAQPAPVASHPANAPAISSSVQESRLQAMTRRDQSGDGAHNVGVAESTSTAQGIRQIQISSCKAHCRGVSQVQAAKQRNRTVQTFGGSRRLTGGKRQLLKDDRSEANSGPPPTAQTSIGLDPASNTRTDLAPTVTRSPTESGKPDLTQIQLGCISHCFGTATRSSQHPLRAPRPTLQQLLDTVVRAMPSLNDAPAAEQNTVAQMSHQWQYGSGLGPGQTQAASQVSTTIQSRDVPMTAAAHSALGAYVPQLVNQTEQGIWQLQIGCLAFCSETRQVQRAEQSNTTMRPAGTERDSSSHPLASSVNVTTQTVWQVQVGCLMWCFDTEQQQTTSSENSEGELPGQEAAEGAPPPAGAAPASGPPSAGAPPPAGAPPAGATPPAGAPPAGAPPPVSAQAPNPCDQSPAPRECSPVASLGGAGPPATGGTARSRPANRARRGVRIVTARSSRIPETRGGHTVTGRGLGAGAGANVAIYRPEVARAPVNAPRNVMGPPRLSNSARRQGSRVLRSLAAGMSSVTAGGSDAPLIALVAAIALCTLAAAWAFSSEPIPRRGAEK